MARPTLSTHPKFAKLCARLRGTVSARAIARGALELIWEAGYAEGDPEIGDAEAVEAIAEWTGPKGALARDLVASGFLDVDAAGVHSIHDLADHAPDYVARRMARAAERVAKGTTISEIRSQARRQMTNGDDKRISFVTNVDPPAPAPAPAPERSDPDQRSFPETGGPSSGTPVDEAIPGLIFETDGRVKTWHVMRSTILDLEESFPSLDVTAEIRKAVSWVKANPRKRKTPDGMKAFLYRWVKRAQNDGAGARSAVNGSHAAKIEAEIAMARLTRNNEKRTLRNGGT